jgi:hypothetical protein
MTLAARRGWLVVGPLLFPGVSGMVAAEACSSDQARAVPVDAAPTIEASASCPSAAPRIGSACVAATSCVYGMSCEQTVVLCSAGRWEIAAPPDASECPVSAPDNGASCSTCGGVASCSYNLACHVDAGPSVTAVCATQSGAAWVVAPHACAVADAGHDARVPSTDAGVGDSRASEGGDARAFDADQGAHESDARHDSHEADGGGTDGSHDAAGPDGQG